MNNMDIVIYETFMEDQRKAEQRRRELEDEARSLLYPNADDEEYEEEMMDLLGEE